MKEYTYTQVIVLVLALMIVFAFLETSDPIWTLPFFKDLLRHIWGYALVSVFVCAIWAGWAGTKVN